MQIMAVERFVLEAKPVEGIKIRNIREQNLIRVSYVPLKVEFFDRGIVEGSQSKASGKQDGRWIARETLIQNEQSKAKTEMSISSIVFDEAQSRDVYRACAGQ